MISRTLRFIRPAILCAALLVLGPSQLPAASQGDHYLLNATSGVVVLNELFAVEHIINYKLDPGYSFVFNGIFMRLEVRMPTGQTLIYSERQLRKLHGGTTPNNGYWLLDDRGLRLVSATDYIAAYQRLHKRRP
jgi:hypothetical protein